ncbi:MAG: phage tail protein [Archaeoglobaceae archaeon]
MIRLVRQGQQIELEYTDAQLTRELMGAFTLRISDPNPMPSVNEIIKARFRNTDFSFIVTEVSEHEVVAEHVSIKLRSYVLVDKYLNIPATYDDRMEFASITLNDLLYALQGNYSDAGFTLVNQSTVTDARDISFAGDNLLSALYKIANVYNVNYFLTDTQIIFRNKVSLTAPVDITLTVGYNTKEIRVTHDTKNLVTRVYPVGSSENLPEGYYYDKLRPTTFNVETKTHSGTLYVQDQQAIEQWGLIEKIVEFPDIKVRSRSGTVQLTGTEYLDEYKRSFPFVQASSLQGINADKAKSCVLFISQGLKAAELQVVHVDPTSGKVYYSPYLKDGTQLTWSPQAGDYFILVGYVGQEEMNAARDMLLAAAYAYLQQYSRPKLKASVDTAYTGSDNIDIGMMIRVQDTSNMMRSFDVITLPCVALTYSFLSKAYQLELAEEHEGISYLWKETLALKNKVDSIRSQVRRVETTVFPNPQTPTPEQGGVEAPESPASLVLQAGVDNLGTYVIASWSVVEGAQHYVVRYSYDNLYFYYLEPVTTTSVQFYVIPGSTVYVQVAAVSAQGIFSSWVAGSIQVGGDLVLPPPSNVRATGIFNEVQVAWNFQHDKLSFVSGFEVQVSDSQDFANAKTAITQATIVNVDASDFLVGNETTVYARVRTISLTGTLSNWSNVVSTTIYKVKGQHIAEATIDSAHIKNAAIKSAHIANAQITNAHIASLDASKITSGYISADRIQAGSITADKLAATLYLMGKTIIAGSSERNFTINEYGIFRRITRGGRVFDREVCSLLQMDLIRIGPNGIATYTIPSPLEQSDVDIFLQPLTIPVSRSGLSTEYTWSYRVGYRWKDIRTIEIMSYISQDTQQTLFFQCIVPTGTYYRKQTPALTERVTLYFYERYWFGEKRVVMNHTYSSAGSYSVGVMWTGVLAGAYLVVDWGDGLVEQKQLGSFMTFEIACDAYAVHYSSNPQRYYVGGDVFVLIFDKR